jgi:hypothetical protein
MDDLREQVVRASSDAQAYRAALFLIFTAPIESHPELVARICLVEALVRQRDRLAEDTARLLVDEGIGTSQVARDAGVSPQYVSKLRHGRRIGHAKTVLVHDAAMRIVAARKQVG